MVGRRSGSGLSVGPCPYSTHVLGTLGYVAAMRHAMQQVEAPRLPPLALALTRIYFVFSITFNCKLHVHYITSIIQRGARWLPPKCLVSSHEWWCQTPRAIAIALINVKRESS